MSSNLESVPHLHSKIRLVNCLKLIFNSADEISVEEINSFEVALFTCNHSSETRVMRGRVQAVDNSKENTPFSFIFS